LFAGDVKMLREQFSDKIPKQGDIVMSKQQYQKTEQYIASLKAIVDKQNEAMTVARTERRILQAEIRKLQEENEALKARCTVLEKKAIEANDNYTQSLQTIETLKLKLKQTSKSASFATLLKSGRNKKAVQMPAVEVMTRPQFQPQVSVPTQQAPPEANGTSLLPRVDLDSFMPPSMVARSRSRLFKQNNSGHF